MKNFKFYNPNPKKVSTDDQAIRALSVALEKDWNTTYDILSKAAKKEGRVLTDTKFIQKFIESNGYTRKAVPRAKEGEKSLTPETFCNLYPTGTYLLKTANTLTVVKDGKFYDIAEDYGRLRVYTYWTK